MSLSCAMSLRSSRAWLLYLSVVLNDTTYTYGNASVMNNANLIHLNYRKQREPLIKNPALFCAKKRSFIGI